MHVEWLGMTRQHYQPGALSRVRMVVVHATAGRAPGDLNWLRQGGDERRPVSVHYYIGRNGRVVQLVKEDDIAWHAGASVWAVDGRVMQHCNRFSIGIELENLNTGRDPYPEVQYAAALELTRDLVRRHNVPRSQLVRHLDIAPGRKTDPAGFPWERFVGEVYAGTPEANDDPQVQLRALMHDLAYRAAGSALPAAWPLYEAARAAKLGMPVASLNGRPLASSPATAQDDRDRPVRIPGQAPLIVEVYARDLLYAPLTGAEGPQASAIRRLSETAPGSLRDALVSEMFRAADPVNGFRPDWAFHQRWQLRAGDLGAPIGPNHRITVDGTAFACQHFALDSLCSPVGAWRTIYHLSELGSATSGAPRPAALRAALLDDLYRARCGRRYDPAALLTRQAESRRLGAPLAPPEVAMVAGRPYLLMAFALDVLACPLPRLTWPLDQPLPAATPVIALNDSPALHGASAPRGTDHLLGGAAAPALHDLLLDAPSGHDRPAPDSLLIAAARGPAAADLRPEAGSARWHYYVTASGAIYRLRDERTGPGDSARGGRPVLIAVEGGPAAAGPAQRAALIWLVRALADFWRIAPQQIIASDGTSPGPDARHANEERHPDEIGGANDG
ncbi:MAG: N-acetylmuramoyl-L-alanine amidase [Oscillochloridaceae bacterium]|nr:N-acetylmuramoyl-L-alanine amidase [Chloroflexaceae bacterium]MDW8392088.1 N-acetylmuramoyl-L-alanine amidase [Oscillochloridaceae bacterium]